MADVHGVWVDRIRTERRAQGWDKPEMARRLAHAAGEARGSLPSHERLLSYVKRWERGDVEDISERYRLLYARAFGMSEEALFGEDGGDVDRRDFVGSSLAAGFTLALPTGAGFEPGRRIGADDIARLRNRTARLRRLDDVLGGAETYPRYAAELKSTVAIADQAAYSGATGRALMGVVAEQAQQAGWAAFDAGWQAPARRHFKDSLTAASDAGDTSLIATRWPSSLTRRSAPGSREHPRPRPRAASRTAPRRHGPCRPCSESAPLGRTPSKETREALRRRSTWPARH
jgi:transcriptional regulator with XRE-family HTH domain